MVPSRPITLTPSEDLSVHKREPATDRAVSRFTGTRLCVRQRGVTAMRDELIAQLLQFRAPPRLEPDPHGQ